MLPTTLVFRESDRNSLQAENLESFAHQSDVMLQAGGKSGVLGTACVNYIFLCKGLFTLC